MRFGTKYLGEGDLEPRRMGIDSESAGALKGSAPYQSPAVLGKWMLASCTQGNCTSRREYRHHSVTKVVAK